MEELIGLQILQISIEDGERLLQFSTDKGIVCYETFGDCCSETWFSDITGVNALIGGTVTEVFIMAMGDYDVEDGRARQECDKAYGYKIVTDKGYADIVFRNSSNGCYGGSIYLTDYAEGKNMTIIKDDWEA